MAKKSFYEALLKSKQSGSKPAKPSLYKKVKAAAKRKFDVYPSAVANAWLVKEYKRKGGTYKGKKNG